MQVLRAIVQALFRQRAVFWALLLVALAAAGGASFLLPPAWRASALVATPQDIGEPTGIGLLASHELHRQVVARLGADKLYPGLDPEAAAEALGHDLAATHRGEDSIRITYDGRTPALAVDALNTTLAVMAEQNAQLLAEASKGSLDQQAEVLKGVLDDAQRRLDAYKEANKLDGAVDQRQELVQRRAELNAQLKDTIDTQAALTARMRSLRAQIEAPAPPPDPAPDQSASHAKIVDEAKARLLDLQLKEQDLLSKYTETSQFVVTVRREIAQVKTFLNDMAPAAPVHSKPTAGDSYVELSKQLVSAETQLSGIEGRRAVLETQLAQADQRLGEINNGNEDLRRLERAVADAETNMRQVDEARNKRAADAGRAPGMTIIERPAAPPRPIRPDPPLYFGLAAAIGLLLGTGGAVLAQVLSSTFETPNDVERRLGLPVLAALPIKT